MRLIGMLDSPYVRRVAVSLQLLELPFEHESVSVFRGFDRFRSLSPVVKAPSLICDDGSVLLDSTLILDYAEALAAPHRSLMPRELGARLRCLHLIGLALAACEKSVQIIYEHNLRPPEKQHEPWLARVRGQLDAAYQGIEAALADPDRATTGETMDQAGITAAVAWHFTQQSLPGSVDPSGFPRLQALSQLAEALPAFAAAPHGESTYHGA
jgi:glutathione S-transferase